jgi:ribosomal protein L18E
MTEKAGPLPADPELDKKIAAYRKRCEARRAEITRDVAQHLHLTTSPGDYTQVSITLFEMACERYLAIHDEEDARDLIERAFRRVLQKRRGPLQ